MSLYTYKVLNNINNHSNKKLFDSFARQNTRPGLRNTTSHSIPRGCSHSFRKSTLPSCINVWNSLPVNIKNCKSVLSLKNKINEQPLSQFSKFPLLTKMKVPRDLEIILFKCRSGAGFTKECYFILQGNISSLWKLHVLRKKNKIENETEPGSRWILTTKLSSWLFEL